MALAPPLPLAQLPFAVESGYAQCTDESNLTKVP